MQPSACSGALTVAADALGMARQGETPARVMTRSQVPACFVAELAAALRASQ
jgi:hypothetical protein